MIYQPSAPLFARSPATATRPRAAGTGPHWVFVHGAGGNSAFWELVRPWFPDAWMVDLPGHAAGRARRASEAPPQEEIGRASIEAYAEWLEATIEARGWAKVVLAGHSMGGAIALAVALRRPAWLGGLVLSSSGARLPVPAALLALLETDYPAAVEWVLHHAFAGPPGAYRREGIRRQLLRVPQAVTLADYRACAAFDIRARIAAGGCPRPALVVCGAGDVMIPPAESAFVADHIPGAGLAGIAGAGHMAPVEQPAAWAGVVLDWWCGLQRTEA